MAWDLIVNEKYVIMTIMNNRKNNAEQVINRFGGQSSLANILGRRQSTIQHWVKTGRIPSQWHTSLLKVAHEKGIALEPRDFVTQEALEPRDFVTQETITIEPADGRLGVLLVGLGAVSSTFIAGVEHVRRGTGRPFGSVTQMATIRLGKRTKKRTPLIREFVPLANLNQLVFGAWDPIPDDGYESAVKCGVLDRYQYIEPIADFLKSIKPMSAVFDSQYVKRVNGNNTKKAGTKLELTEAVRDDIRRFKINNKCDRLVMIWCASTEKFITASGVHQDLKSFKRGLLPHLVYIRILRVLKEGSRKTTTELHHL
jgi:myo-inositol-1-phosphate synthase